MFLRQVDLTTALRPELLPDETLLFVQDAVGLYEGKFKLPQYQNGHAYLTSHRACYVDNEEPRKNSVAVDLKDVERIEFYAGFLKSSPKVTLYAKPTKHTSLRGPYISYSPGNGSPARQGSPAPSVLPAASLSTSATWVCPICSFSNSIPSNFDPVTANSHTPLPPCQTCGIKPPLAHVVKAALAALSNKPATFEELATFRCPRCTFENHPSLLTCEVCGASLVSVADRRLELQTVARSDSPAPMLREINLNDDLIDSIKFSFRAGGEKIFHERLKNAIVQRKWLLQNAPPIPKPLQDLQNVRSGSSIQQPTPSAQKMVGISALENRGAELRKNNEVIIGNAFEDLEALMTSAKEIIALAERFSAQAKATNGDAGSVKEADGIVSALGLATTKDILGSSSTSDTLYISELSRNLAEFLTDDKAGILKREGGIISLVDLWAVFNRARGGVELISPTDFVKAAEMWDKLKLPLRLRKFKSGLLAVQGRDRTDEKTVASLLAWLKELRSNPPPEDVSWDWRLWGRGVTAQDAAARFGWSVGVASEELEMAEEKGALCREHGIDGLRFWENWLVMLPAPTLSST